MKDVFLATAIGFIFFMSRGIAGPIKSLYAESLGASLVFIGVLGTAGSLTTILFSAMWGRASDYLQRRKHFLTGGLGALALVNVLIAIAPNYKVLLPLRILAAVFEAAYVPASFALMGDLLERDPDKRGRRMGTYRGLCSLGFGLMAFLAGSVADWLSLGATYALAAVFLAVAFLLALRVEEPSSHSVDEDRRIQRGAVPGSEPVSLYAKLLAEGRATRMAVGRMAAGLRQSRESSQPPDEATATVERPNRLPLAPLFVSVFLWWLVTGAVYSVWANYMVGEIGHSQAQMSRLWSLASMSELPFMIWAGWLSDRIGRIPTLSLGFLAWTIVFIGYVTAPVMPWIVLIQLLRGFAYSAFTATALTYAAEVRSRARRGRISGFYSSIGGAGAMVGASMGGALAQFAGFRTMIITNAVAIFSGAVYLAVVGIRRSLHISGTATGRDRLKQPPLLDQ